MSGCRSRSALARKFEPVIGFDISQRRIAALRDGDDTTGEVDRGGACARRASRSPTIPTRSCEASFFIVTVPTPIDAERRPDLAPLASACGADRAASADRARSSFSNHRLSRRDRRGLRAAARRSLGPRARGSISSSATRPSASTPATSEHRLETIVKVVAGEDARDLERVAGVYGPVVEAGRAPRTSIEVAEAAKVIENTQRDLNIALMNELAMIFDRLGIRPSDVLRGGRRRSGISCRSRRAWSAATASASIPIT